MLLESAKLRGILKSQGMYPNETKMNVNPNTLSPRETYPALRMTEQVQWRIMAFDQLGGMGYLMPLGTLGN